MRRAKPSWKREINRAKISHGCVTSVQQGKSKTECLEETRFPYLPDMSERKHDGNPRQVPSVSDTLSSGLSENKGRLANEMGGPTDNCTVETWNFLVWPREHGETHRHPVTAPVGGESRKSACCASRQTSVDHLKGSGHGETALVRGRGPPHGRPGQRPVEKRGSTKKVEFTEGSRWPSSLMHPGTHDDQQMWGYR